MMKKVFCFILILTATFVVNSSITAPVYARSNTQTETEVIEVPVANINTASVDELQMISGIGPTLATRIIRYRSENGKFSTVEDIMKVKGVGTAKFEKIKEHLKV
ncbi:MAG: helix-hairpin-helix domain-containing protein [Candidatus Omnitrophica bacterium]|nr:helix-hairpin-helix domain-containing protein [Candidatus Omnitrophota bacterium]